MSARFERESWKNRIVGSGEERPADLLAKANPANWRIHPSLQQVAVASALAEVGWVQQVVVNSESGHLVDGHLRVLLAQRRGEDSVPVLYVSLSPEEELLVLASLDPLGAMAEAEDQRLDDLLRQVSTESAAIAELLAQLGRQEVADDRLGWDGAGSVEIGSLYAPTLPRRGAPGELPASSLGESKPTGAVHETFGVEFQEFDESVAREVKYIECPSCGYKWPK